MFSDKVRIFIKSGKGGDGHVSFRRELYVPAGGPDGGNGGHGGDIIFQVDKGLNTLGDFRHNSKYIAQSGEEGGKKRCTGKNGEDLIIKVPEGTVIYDVHETQLLQMMLAVRIFLPFASITISTRERAGFRDHVLPISATKISAGVNVGIGGHTEEEQKGDAQFEISDGRSLAEIHQAILEQGMQPVYTDYINTNLL